MIWANLGYGIKLTRTILDQKKVLGVSEISGITLGFFFYTFFQNYSERVHRVCRRRKIGILQTY